MAEKTKITFRGKKVTLAYPLLAFKRLESVGVKLSELESLGDDSIDIDLLGKLIWAGLSCQFNDATVDEVLVAYDITDLETLSKALNEAFGNAAGK